MSLEIAAGTALEKVKELLPHVESSQERLERASERIESAAAELERHWEELESQARAFDEHTRQRSHEMAARQDAQARRIEHLADELEDVKDRIRDEQEETIDALHGLAEEAGQAREELSDLMERAAEDAERYVERQRGLDERLARLVETLSHALVEDMAASLSHLGHEVDACCDRLQGVLAAGLSQAFAAGQAGLDAVSDAAGRIGQELKASEERVEAHATRLAHETAQRLADAAAEIAGHWEQAEGALAELEGVLDEQAAAVQHAEDMLRDAGHETGSALDEVIQGVSGALEFFSRFSFV